MTPSRRLCWSLVAVGALVFAIVALTRVSWSWVPGGRLVPVNADRMFAPRTLAELRSYAAGSRVLGLSGTAVSLLVSLVIGLTPIGRRLAGPVRWRWWGRVLLAVALALVVGWLATLPIALAERSRQFTVGLTRQPLAGWLRDELVGLGVSWVYVALGALLLVGLARRLPRRWPLVAAAGAAALVVLGSFLYPLLVEPLFNSFRPMPPGPLRSQIMVLAHREGVRLSDVLVADASRRTTSLNAYVNGFGATRQVVVYDNLLRNVPLAQIRVVVAHELGHAARDDVLTGTLLGAAGVVVGVGLLGLVVPTDWLRRRTRTAGPGDPGVVPALLALVAVASLATSPLQNAASRAIEARADRAALMATHDPAAFVALQRSLVLAAHADPSPPAVLQWWFGTHPTMVQRVGLADALTGFREGR